MRLAGDEVLDWVLTMGPHAEVVAPPELREAIRGRLEASLRLYADTPAREAPR
jgi:predicted DNA-binding transcriptional regulator YafY